MLDSRFRGLACSSLSFYCCCLELLPLLPLPTMFSRNKGASTASATALTNAETYLARIESLIDQHRRLNTRAQGEVDARSPDHSKLSTYEANRGSIKTQFIGFKTSVKQYIEEVTDLDTRTELSSVRWTACQL